MSLIAYERLAQESWDRLQQAADDPTHPMRLLVLATSAPDGTPDSRVMVLRGANGRMGRIWFYTDRRSVKLEHLRHRPLVCAVGFDPNETIQLRLRGTTIIHESSPLADQHWTQANLLMRQLYASPDAPGSPFSQTDPRLVGLQKAVDTGHEERARRNFTVIEMQVQCLEWHQIHGQEQRRAIMHASTGWAVQPIAP
ncbi:MAG: pyridoxamine 5'-phosphate oxidase family protein [Planctomycetota bacterium]|jgi:general stress protein 26